MKSSIDEILVLLKEGKRFAPVTPLMFKPFSHVGLKVVFESGDIEVIEGYFPAIKHYFNHNKILEAKVICHSSNGYKPIEYVFMNPQGNCISAKLKGIEKVVDYPFGLLDLQREWEEYKEPVESKIVVKNCPYCNNGTHYFKISELVTYTDSTTKKVFCPTTDKEIIL